MDQKPITINTKTKKPRHVEIDGVSYYVRNLGAGEQLSLSQIQRRITKLSTVKEPSEEEQDELLDLTTKLFSTIASAFDDGGDGSKTKAMFDKLDAEDLSLLLEQVFVTQVNTAEKPDETTTA